VRVASVNVLKCNSNLFLVWVLVGTVSSSLVLYVAHCMCLIGCFFGQRLMQQYAEIEKQIQRGR
jgi:hypothetical protein